MEYDCDCPYDWGVVCKHVVAVLFYLQKDLLDLDNLTKVKASPRKKKESETLQMEQILKHLTHDELRAFVRDMCATDKRFPAFVRGEAYAKFVSGIERVIRETIGKTGENVYRKAWIC